MISIKEAIIVEGKYDKIRLSGIFDTAIVSTEGFNIFTNEGKQKLIRRLAEDRGIIILTDSDRAGFLIRNFICGIVDNKYIKHAYVPQIEGVEKRKIEKSKDGFLGVEGIDNDIIRRAIEKSASVVAANKKNITKATLYRLGLSGKAGSNERRDKLLKYMDMPKGITPNALVTLLNCLYTEEEITEICEKI